MKPNAWAIGTYSYTEHKPESSAEDKENRRENRKELVFITLISVLMASVFFAGLFLAGHFVVNEFYNAAYRQGYFLNRQATCERRLVRPEGYVQYYNTGNNDFKNGAYEEAMDAYTKALEEEPLHINGDRVESEGTTENTIEDPECLIRINLALSILYQIDFENIHTNDRTEVDKAVEMLLLARKALTDGDCAHYTDSGGHNFHAEELKKEIDELLNRLNRKPPQEEEKKDKKPQDEEEQEEKDQDQEQSQREKDIQKQLEDEMKRAKEEQSKAQRDREGRDQGYGNNNGQNW